jgi:hypothetical protein
MAGSGEVIWNVTARETTAGAAEQDLSISLNGAVGAASVAIPDGSQLQITDNNVNCVDVANFRLQQTNDGGGSWFDLMPLRLPGDGNIGQSLNTAIVVDGGSNVAIRVRAETPNGAALVGASLQGVLRF